MLHMTVTMELIFTGRVLNHAKPDCDLGPCLKTGRDHNHATPDCDLGPFV